MTDEGDIPLPVNGSAPALLIKWVGEAAGAPAPASAQVLDNHPGNHSVCPGKSFWLPTGLDRWTSPLPNYPFLLLSFVARPVNSLAFLWRVLFAHLLVE
jgi:hypothetical protein